MSATSPPVEDTQSGKGIKGTEGGVTNTGSRNLVRVIVLVIVLIWLIPAIGLLITSLRTPAAIESSGWWTVFASIGDTSQWTLQNYREVLESNGFAGAFLNTLVVSVPATIMPIVIATFAAYAFSWMEFKGRFLMFVFVVALLVVPLHVALIPILQLYNGGPLFDVSWLAPVVSFLTPWEVVTVEVGIPLDLNGTFLGVWLAHTGFGLPLAVYLLRNYIGSLPSELMESARIDGADHYAIFTRLIIPLSVPALASFAIFQFLWVFNDFLVALVFLGETADVRVLTIALNALNGQFQNSWHLLTAGAFISMVLPMVVFFSLQRFFVRGMTAGAVKG
ncbi:carbohydrate ABC transporter permease [Salsipaludibacter albus]|uniref:carbohydrate ABC transporter permease n=1 Tax=Salsipaludibacter albus TaxID=2849650 RepID=UPI001EE46A0E|nr:carbohydrate ABC transporter permease [Salsipaludibacter albus]MBY5160907.1 carbohydrate ABC transporter permease [Salsipaludibacter albus]